MPEAEITTNGEYEDIRYHLFEAVDYDRHMSWKATKEGFIYAGVKNVERLNGDVDTVDAVLPKGQIVIIFSMCFQLATESVNRPCPPKSRQAETTANGDYEHISWHRFEALDYDRLMSWKATNKGFVCTGTMVPLNRSVDTVDAVLPKGVVILVSDMCFKLTSER
ncbi:hypothetical protein BU24DRAFT_370608 [Aaosphaeria arxii CBS 175.79]|uniref:Uncharacterized protein n=1 Tax=Aaosphaeria arxii CBS 175.79 TaxID=1450172 RepID=A0A6A5XVQ0_9PLEO|nr:uncharacterized protein BU24DRAFT_370608 [Aaosphaeria arxii CBS 175.79]KAF2016710.1 hypothetical protein BU24DRAFT_370608 [Aaosphaeria arxii CBS 175.79]